VPGERERAGRQRLAGVADSDERGAPQCHGDQRGDQGQHVRPRRRLLYCDTRAHRTPAAGVDGVSAAANAAAAWTRVGFGVNRIATGISRSSASAATAASDAPAAAASIAAGGDTLSNCAASVGASAKQSNTDM